MPQNVIMRPGEKFQIPTIDEYIDPVNQLLAKLGKNARFQRGVFQVTSDAAGTFTIQEGPNDGFMWAVLLVTVDPGNATGTYNLYVNGTSPVSQVTNVLAGLQTVTFSKSQLVLKGNDKLIVKSGAVASAIGYPVGLAVHAIEVPIAHEAQLLL